jgi:hypothetical protein
LETEDFFREIILVQHARRYDRSTVQVGETWSARFAARCRSNYILNSFQHFQASLEWGQVLPAYTLTNCEGGGADLRFTKELNTKCKPQDLGPTATSWHSTARTKSWRCTGLCRWIASPFCRWSQLQNLHEGGGGSLPGCHWQSDLYFRKRKRPHNPSHAYRWQTSWVYGWGRRRKEAMSK